MLSVMQRVGLASCCEGRLQRTIYAGGVCNRDWSRFSHAV